MSNEGMVAHYRLESINKEQQKALEAFKSRVSAAELENDDRDDEVYLRFLVARAFDSDRALDMYTKQLSWRREQKPERVLTLEADLVELKRKKSVWWPHTDKLGRPLMIAHGNRHLSSFPQLQEKVDHAIWCLESGSVKCGPGGGFVIIADLAGIGWKNVEYGFVNDMVNILQNYYPERMGGLWLLNCSYMFSIIWRVIRPWLDPRTVSKIVILRDDGKEFLRQHVDVDKLPERFGGTCEDSYLDPDEFAPRP